MIEIFMWYWLITAILGVVLAIYSKNEFKSKSTTQKIGIILFYLSPFWFAFALIYIFIAGLATISKD